MVMSLLSLLLYCAVIIFVAFIILWVMKWMGVGIDGDVLKWGKIVVALLIIIAVVSWVLGVVNVPMINLRHY